MKRQFPWLILLLVVLAVMLLMWELLFKPRGQEGVSPTPTPVASPTPTKGKEPVTLEEKKERAVKFLPIVTSNYSIQYLQSQDKFLVIILNNPFETYQEEAREWFRSMGVDVEKVKIEWGSSRYVAPGVGN